MKRVLDYKAIYYLFDPVSVIDVLHPVPLPYLTAFRAGRPETTRVTATTEGLIARFGAYGRQRWWRIPTGTEMFIDWLGRRGIRARVSAAGKRPRS